MSFRFHLPPFSMKIPRKIGRSSSEQSPLKLLFSLSSAGKRRPPPITVPVLPSCQMPLRQDWWSLLRNISPCAQSTTQHYPSGSLCVYILYVLFLCHPPFLSSYRPQGTQHCWLPQETSMDAGTNTASRSLSLGTSLLR